MKVTHHYDTIDIEISRKVVHPMQQQTFTDVEYSRRKKKTRREEFLNMMDKIIPWNEWINLIKPYYPSGKRGRPTRGIETMLRMYLMQNWFNLSDAAIEDTIYDSYAMRSFMHIDFYKERYSGSMSRSFYIGEGIKEEDVHAKFEHGVLHLELPKEKAPEVPEKKLIQIE